MKDQIVALNDRIVLIPEGNGKKLCLTVEDKSEKIPGLGVYNTGKLVGIEYGSTIELGRKRYWLLPATTIDHIDTLRRKAQIILPKDAALLCVYCDIKPGSIVVEGGLGSGALTTVLLSMVGPEGKVSTYEKRDDFAKIGSENVSKLPYSNNWILMLEDISLGIAETNVDAIVLDIPEPWLVVEVGYKSLRPGGMFAGYVPTINQVEKLVGKLKELPFIEIKSFETLMRQLVVKSGATRPGYDMLGHTGYITIARKVLGD